MGDDRGTCTPASDCAAPGGARALTPGAWASVAAVCALGAISPGPSLAVVVRHALSGSRARGIACALAHAAGVGLYALLTVAGLAAVLLARPALHRVLAIAGALYLVWLGMGALRVRRAAAGEATAAPPAGVGAAARDGLVIALLNPKIAAFFLALFSQFVAPDSGVRDGAILALTAMAIDAAWYCLVALALSRRGRTDWLRRRRAWIERLTGVVLVAVGAWTLAHALAA